MKTIVMKAKATHGEQGDVQQYLTSRSCRDDVRQFLNAALSENTLRAYRTDLQHFIAWGGVIPAPPEMIATYLAQHATTLAGTTLSRRLVAIARAHAARGLPSPTSSALVRATLQGVRRSLTNTVRQVAPLQKAQLLRMVHGLKDLRGLRDTAMLLIGFAGALRRSELVALDVEDMSFTSEGTVLRLRRSKTDQQGRGRDIAIPLVKGRYCPTRSLQTWLQAAGITTGALFRRVNRYGRVLPQRLTSQSVALIIKQRAESAGFDPEIFSGHSLRAGFVTNAASAGSSSASIRATTGHKSEAILQRYIRHSSLFTDNANRKIW